MECAPAFQRRSARPPSLTFNWEVGSGRDYSSIRHYLMRSKMIVERKFRLYLYIVGGISMLVLIRMNPLAIRSSTWTSSWTPPCGYMYGTHDLPSIHGTPSKERKMSSPSSLQIPSLSNVRLPSNHIYKDSMIEHRLPWIKELYQLLVHTNTSWSPQVNLLVADKKAVELLLNWLIIALVGLAEPLQNVVVLGIDVQVCDLLHPRDIFCIYIDPDTIILPPELTKSFFSRRFLAPQIRLLVSRLVNYWGYSLATYDTDALILKNPQALYDAHKEVTVIAGAANVGPSLAVKKWGFAVCPGAMLIRSGPAAG